MEKKLRHLFDYQKFQKNPRLEAMLSEAERRYENGLLDEDLELVSAAGEPGLDTHMLFMPPEEIITCKRQKTSTFPTTRKSVPTSGER